MNLCRELTRNSQTYEKQNRENTWQKKIIRCGTRQYLRCSTIYLHPQSYKNFTIIKKKYKVQQYSFFSLLETTATNRNHRDNVFLSGVALQIKKSACAVLAVYK